jgi:glycosyltransferase involved in cell wall biosynthesis
LTAILVSHPHGNANACGLAAGLARADKLGAFITGVAAPEGTTSGGLLQVLARRHPVLRNRVLPGELDGRLVPLGAVELGARGGSWLLRELGVRTKAYDSVFVLHDAAVSWLPWPRGTTMVYAYEDGALRTFRRAARTGIARTWDLPLPHYRTIEQIFRDEIRRWPGAMEPPPAAEPAWKQRRKDAELALATLVSVASAFTRKSLERTEVKVPVVVVPYGFPVESFSAKAAAPNAKLTVLAVGTHDLRKGTPYLLEAWKRAAIPDAELHLVGPMRLTNAFLSPYAGTFKHWPHVPRAELGARYASADVLAFPTLGDGFGLVMQEAMCSGTPVVTTSCGGGPECITDGVDGWLVPARDVDALVERLRWCAGNRDRLFSIGKAARARAEQWTWKHAEDALVRALAA